jgi:hypothetical protein
MALAGSEERAGWEGSASVSTIHAPFPTEVECKMTSITHLRISSRMTLPDPTRCSGCGPPFALKNRLLQSWSELQIRIMQLEREGSPTPGLRLPQAKLSRKPNRIALGRIRWFESDMPSHAVDRHCRPASPPLGSYRRQ